MILSWLIIVYFDSINLSLDINPMTEIRQKKENVKMHLKELRQNLKKMHLEVTLYKK